MGPHPMDKVAVSFGSLAGRELSSVCFVRDYVEFYFDGAIFRSLASPILVQGTRRFTFPEQGFRDAVCEMIGRSVHDVADRPDRIVLVFEEMSQVEIPKYSEEAGAEVAHFVPMIQGKVDPTLMKVWENQRPTRDS